MRTITRPLAALTLLGGFLAGCSTGSDVTPDAVEEVATTADTGATTTASTVATSVEEVLGANLEAHETETEWDAAAEVAIDLADGATTVSGAGAVVDGDTVTITRAGTYRLSGTLTDGQIVVSSAADGLVRLVLDGVDVTSSTSAAIAVEEAEQAVLVLADGTTNALADTARTVAEDSEEPDGALFSRADLTITGTGALAVTGSTNDGIAANDGLVIDSGTLTVEAVDDGIRGKDYLVVSGGDITVSAADDGLKSDEDEDATAGYIAVLDGSVTVEAGGDALDAASDIVIAGGALDLAGGDDGVHARESLLIAGGTLAVVDSYEGLEAPRITVSGGDVSIVATDDGINAAGDEEQATGQYSVTITGGTVSIDADGDGLDSNGTVEMSGGTVVILGPTDDGNGAIDVDGTFTIDGGVLFAAGSSGMASAPGTHSPQASILATFATQPAGTVVTVATSDGEVVASFESTKEFSSVVLSSSAIVAGQTYEIYAGGTLAGTPTAGLYDDGDLTGASTLATVTGGEYAAGGTGGGVGGPAAPRAGTRSQETHSQSSGTSDAGAAG